MGSRVCLPTKFNEIPFITFPNSWLTVTNKPTEKGNKTPLGQGNRDLAQKISDYNSTVTLTTLSFCCTTSSFESAEGKVKEEQTGDNKG